VWIVLLAPLTTFAASVHFKVVPNNVVGDEAAIVEAYIDPQGKTLNVVEGIIRVQEEAGAKVSSVVVETGGSVLTTWPVVPRYSYDTNKVIRFTGGVPNGFNNEGLLFRMRLFASNPGKVTISWIGGGAYLNDGKGTEEGVFARSITISLAQGKPNLMRSSTVDSTPPDFDTIEVGRDPSVYEGKYFVSFHAIDDVSGVSHYDVREGQETVTVSNGVYVVKDQERNTPVVITAYDQAGNSRSVRVHLKYSWRNKYRNEINQKH